MVEILLAEDQELKDCLPELAETIVQRISGQDPEHSQELLSAFVSQLFMSATRQSISRERKARQAQGIAEAKARGVRFGIQRKPLPDNFDEVRFSWRNRDMNLKDAARLCGMAPTTFYDAVRRAEEEDTPAGQGGKKFKPLPENFEKARMAWRSHELKLEDAAKLCGMATSTFYSAVRRMEQDGAEEQEAS